VDILPPKSWADAKLPDKSSADKNAAMAFMSGSSVYPGSVADPDPTPPPAGGGVNMPILEACAAIRVIAGVTVVIVREVTVRAAA
jgi:hypothetical protein